VICEGKRLGKLMGMGKWIREINRGKRIGILKRGKRINGKRYWECVVK
jgi:hypothetical protein